MRRSLTATTALLLGSATPAFAAEGGLLSVNPGLTIWTIIIFVIVLIVLSRFAFPKILGAVEAREEHIRELTAAAERDRAEAAALRAENQRILDETRGRVQEALADSRNTAERMRADALEQARAEREEMLGRARADIATEREMALAAVRRDAVELAMAAAEKLVRRNLDAEDNRRLVREYLGAVDAAPAAARA